MMLKQEVFILGAGGVVPSIIFTLKNESFQNNFEQ